MKVTRINIPGLKNGLAAASALLILSACGEPSFKLKGTVEGAESGSIVLEKADFLGQWMPVDSTHIGGNGSFAFSNPAPAAPEIYRLNFDGNYIYIPVDSIETIEVVTSLNGFGRDFTLSGTPDAERMAKFDKELMTLPHPLSQEDADSFKRKVYSEYMQNDLSSVVSYYILTKTIDGKPLYDVDRDYRYFSAVATGYSENRPTDPHAQLLTQTSLDAQRRRNVSLGKTKEIEADELTMVDINLTDEKGVERRLSDVVSKGKPTVVVFSLLTASESPEFNRRLMQSYRARGGNVEFYNVSPDPDQYAWRDAAVNLPWITVYDPEGEYSTTALRYNVAQLPAFFIYNSAGELVDRAADFGTLDRMLSKY